MHEPTSFTIFSRSTLFKAILYSHDCTSDNELESNIDAPLPISAMLFTFCKTVLTEVIFLSGNPRFLNGILYDK